MKNLAALSVILFATATIAACGGGISSGEVLVDVSGTKITEGDLEFLGEINPRIKAQITNEAGKRRILENLVEQDLLYKEAVKKGISRDSKVKAKIDLYRRVIIAQSLIDKEVDEAAEKYYKDNQGEFEKLKLSHIMVSYASPGDIKGADKKAKQKLHAEDEALKIINQLKGRLDKGEDFSKVARENSEDVSTKGRGGDLGLASKDDKRLAARGYGPLLERAFAMKVGEIAGPVKTMKGYHLITVTRGVELEPLEEAKRQILFKVQNDTRQDLLARLKKNATIVYPEEEKRKKEAEEKAEKAKKAEEEKKEAGAKKAEETKAGEEQKVAAEAEKKTEPLKTEKETVKAQPK